jgi:hypothetical protein
MSRATAAAVAILTVLILSCSHAFASPFASAATVAVSPASVTLVSKRTQQFTAIVNGVGTAAIKWMVAGVVGGDARVGTISSSGLYTAPAVASNSVVTLTAVAALDSRVLANAEVTVAVAPAVAVVDPGVEKAHQQWLAGAVPAVTSNSAAMLTGVAASNSRVSANAAVTVAVNPAVEEAHQQWLTGVTAAATRYGCSPDLIQQLPSETVADVVKLYAETAHKGSCLVLLPVSTDAGSTWYSFASGGTIDGVEILYLSDVNRMRIWNGVEVTGN